VITVVSWLYFVLIQLLGLATDAAGLVVLAPACYLHSWTQADTLSINPDPPGRRVDRWSWGWLNAVWGNPEDGVSGAQALIATGGRRRPYLPASSAGWRAYRWSALRNRSDGMKYRLAWQHGPFYRRQLRLFGERLVFKAGWQLESGIKVPVLSLRAP
jgi:hypothetical protein